VSGVLPKALLIDERRGVLVLAAAPPDHVGSALLSAGWRPEPQVAAALGRSLAEVHEGTRGVPVPHEVSSGVLGLPDVGAAVLGLDRARGLAATVGRDPVLAPVLQRAARSWAPSCLVHGDVKWDNCLVHRDTTPPTVQLVDWELAGWGDPAWDLAAALAQGSALALDEPAAADEGHAALVSGYASVAGRGVPARAARFWPGRVVHLALECAEVGADDAAGQLLEAARELAAAGDALDDRVAAWTG
jgi:aminoglycoside phosphotransferase (APT) family kinase protein